jgi:hypothetical protein
LQRPQSVQQVRSVYVEAPEASTGPARVTFATKWAGYSQTEGLAAYLRAREAGLSMFRSLALGHVGSFEDGWIFRPSLAELVTCCVRTIGRALKDGREAGLVKCVRGGKKEIPPGIKKPLKCGFSHRWTTGWGKGAEVVREAVEKARADAEKRKLKRVAIGVVQPAKKREPAGSEPKRRRWTAEEIDAEAARRAAEDPDWLKPKPPKPDTS